METAEVCMFVAVNTDVSALVICCHHTFNFLHFLLRMGQ